jgi:hypothetical protein
MPLEEKRRLVHAGRMRIKHLLRSFYNRWLVDPVPDRLLAVVREGNVREQGGGARRSEDSAP